MNIDLTETEKAEPCACCHEAPSAHRDRDVGIVCTECFCLLLSVQMRLKMLALAEAAARESTGGNRHP